MLNQKTKEALMGSWGDKAESMDCYIEVKYIDPDSNWACYVYALNPSDEDKILCIIDGEIFQICEWSLQSLEWTYNKSGEFVVIDPEFRRIKARDLYKKIKRDDET